MASTSTIGAGSILRSTNSSATAKTQKLELTFSLCKINIDPKSTEPHFFDKKLQLKVSSGPKSGSVSNTVGKTELKKILAAKAAKVALEFSTKLSLDCFESDTQIRVQLLVDDVVYGTTTIDQKLLEEACVSEDKKSIRKKFRTSEDKKSKILECPFVEIKVEAYAALAGAPVIDISELKFIRVIGKGAFGEVWEGECRQCKVAIKKIINSRKDQSAIDEFMQEMFLMRDNPHPNLVLLIGICYDRPNGDVYCVTELLLGDVYKLLIDTKPKKIFPLASIIDMAIDAAAGIAWLHSRTPSILHRDIKPSNFLYDQSFRIRVGDFGLSKELSSSPSPSDLLTIAGSPIYMAPEAVMVGGPGPSVKSDVYSFAISLWEMLTQTPVFQEYTNGTIPNPREHWEKNVIRGSYRPHLLDSWPLSLQSLLSEMWSPNPQDRPDFQTIVPRLKEMKAECLEADELRILQTSIVDPLGIKFWMRFFSGESAVSFTRFYIKFLPFLGLEVPADRLLIPLPDSATIEQLESATIDQLDQYLTRFPDRRPALHHLLCNRDQNRVAKPPAGGVPNFLSDDERVLASLSRYLCEDEPSRIVKTQSFGQFLEYFGPLDPSDLRSIMVRFRELVKRPYFFGTPPKARAQQILSTSIQSTVPPNFQQFLIRTSNSSKGGFTLEYGSEKDTKIIRVAINRLPDGRFYTGEPSSSNFTTYDSIHAFLLSYFTKRGDSDASSYVNTRHCQHSPYLIYWLNPIIGPGEAYSQPYASTEAYSTPEVFDSIRR